jgi:hypothetical protein
VKKGCVGQYVRHWSVRPRSLRCFCFKIGRDFVMLLVAIFIVATLIHMLIASLVRYRVPYVDAYLSMLAGVALWKLGQECFTRQRTAAVAQRGSEA